MELSIAIDYRDKMRYLIPLIINIDTENMGLESLPVILIIEIVPFIAPLFDFPVFVLFPQVVFILQRGHHRYYSRSRAY